jgi:hypothetical protein
MNKNSELYCEKKKSSSNNNVVFVEKKDEKHLNINRMESQELKKLSNNIDFYKNNLELYKKQSEERRPSENVNKPGLSKILIKDNEEGKKHS